MRDPRIKAMHSDWLECYSGLKHNMPTRAASYRRIKWDGHDAEEWTYVCQRCPCVRIDVIDRQTEEVLSRQYPHVVGYHSEHGEGRLDRADIRRELRRRKRKNDYSMDPVAEENDRKRRANQFIRGRVA